MLIASSAYADKTITQKTVVLPNITRLNVDVVAGVPAAIVTYQVVDSTGTAIGHNKSLTVPLTGPQTTTLVNFLTTVILPAINVAEGT